MNLRPRVVHSAWHEDRSSRTVSADGENFPVPSSSWNFLQMINFPFVFLTEFFSTKRQIDNTIFLEASVTGKFHWEIFYRFIFISCELKLIPIAKSTRHWSGLKQSVILLLLITWRYNGLLLSTACWLGNARQTRVAGRNWKLHLSAEEGRLPPCQKKGKLYSFFFLTQNLNIIHTIRGRGEKWGTIKHNFIVWNY